MRFKIYLKDPCDDSRVTLMHEQDSIDGCLDYLKKYKDYGTYKIIDIERMIKYTFESDPIL